MARQRKPQRHGIWGQIVALYELLCDPFFAIVVVLALAVASILGLVIIDQIPFRGEMAPMAYPERQGDPLIWILTHIVPASPFRSLVYRTLLALLSLSLLACTVKRWRLHWRQALTVAAPGADTFDSAGALQWVTLASAAGEEIQRFLRGRLFALRVGQSREPDETLLIGGKRFGISRLGPVLTHLGFLLLVVGGLWMASSGSSEMVWLRPGEEAALPEIGARLRLDDFRIERTARGQIADYISNVTLYADTGLVRQAEIEVNSPLRYRGHSIYQTSYRDDPMQVREVDLVLDLAALDEEALADSASAAAAGGATERREDEAPDERGPHERVPLRFSEPITHRVPWGARVALEPTNYAVEIDTFFADFRIGANGPGLASSDHRNPAVHLRFFQNDQPAGETWYFALHPGMSAGSGPDLPLRLASYTPVMTTGLDVSTHPGSEWVWAGIAVMSLGTLLAFVLRYERVQLRLRRRAEGWEVTLLHQGAPKQAPEYARASWERSVTPLALRMLREWEPERGRPVRWPGRGRATLGDADSASGRGES